MPRKNSSSNSSSGLRQIAEKAGVSAMTVSRVLRGSPHVSPDVRQRVLQAVAESGYKRDPAMSKLMVHLRLHKQSRYQATIAAITTIPEAMEPHPIRLVREGARLCAEIFGYRLDVFRLKSAEGHNRNLERILTSRGIEGILLLQMFTPSNLDHLLDWPRYSVAAATSSIVSPDFVRIGANYYHNARVLCEALAARGCRRIGFVGTRTFGVRTNDAFISAICAKAMESGVTPVRPYILPDNRLTKRDLHEWLAREKPDSIITGTEETVVPIRRALAASHYSKIPIFCTSVDPAKPVCAGIDERHELIGRNAIEVLTSMMNRNEKNLTTAHMRTLVEGRWIQPE